MKKILSFALVLALIFALFGTLSVSAEDALTLQYDDRFEFEGRQVSSITNQAVASYKVGWDIAENGVKDDNVLKVDSADSSKIIATGVGSATVNFADGSSRDVTVTAAPLSIFFIIGQSNGEGVDGKYSESVANPDGTAYATYGPNNAWAGSNLTGYEYSQGLSVDTAYSFVGDSLTGYQNVKGEPLSMMMNATTRSGLGKSGPDSAIAYEFHRLTGDKVWTINAAHSGTSIKLWDPEDASKSNEYYQAIGVMKNAAAVAEKEIAAGHYTLSHLNYVWWQGESDNFMSTDEYAERYVKMHNALKNDCKINGRTFEFGGQIAARYALGNGTMYTYQDIYMNGQRMAHYYLANSPEHKDIVFLSDIGDEWVDNDAGQSTGALKRYFKEHYPDGVLDYPTQSGEPNKVITSAADMHYVYHFCQTGYNEIGFDAARTLCGIYGKITRESELELINKDGHSRYDDEVGVAGGKVLTVIPKFTPCVIDTNGVTVETTGGIAASGIYEYTVNGSGSIIYKQSGRQIRKLDIVKVIYGDVNDDGKINAKDVLLARKVLAKWTGLEYNKYAADVIVNGKVTSADVLRLRQYVARWQGIKLGPIE